MRLLLDTNVFVSMFDDKDMLTKDVSAMLEDCENLIYISTISIVELITLYRKKKLLARVWSTEREMIDYIYNSQDFIVDNVDHGSLSTLADLHVNTAQDHNDPNDHLIIAQAISHRLTLVSSDTKFPFYRNQGLKLIENR